MCKIIPNSLNEGRLQNSQSMKFIDINSYNQTQQLNFKRDQKIL